MYEGKRNFAEDIEQEAGDEPIEAVVIGRFGWGLNFGAAEMLGEDYTEPPHGEVLEWQKARPYLDYEYDPGYGGPECHAIWAWTVNKVLLVVEYDGATHVSSIPRNPIPGEPDTYGG